MQHTRPKNLNLLTIHFPSPAIVSILHRVSGFVLFMFIPFLIWGLQYSLEETGYNHLKHFFGLTWVKLLLLALFVPFVFHLIAGIRHLLSDIHIGDTLPAGYISAWLVFILTIISLGLIGVWLW